MNTPDNGYPCSPPPRAPRASRTDACSLLAHLVAAGALALAAVPAHAQGYPEKPVRAIVPFPPGGAADIVARHVAQKLTEAFGVQFIVDNRAGAGGAIGAEAAARAAPDGYTLLLASSSAMSINPHIVAKAAYDPLRSFTPVGLIGYSPNVLVVHPSVPARSVKELIALARSRPESLSYASNGAGTLSHLTGELFMQRAGVKLLHVPYKGAAPAVIDTIAGQVSMLYAAYPSIAGQARAEAARDGGDQQHARDGCARDTDRRRSGAAGIRVDAVVGGVRAAGPARRRRRTPERRAQQGPAHRGHPQAFCARRRRAGRRQPRGPRALSQGRFREVGQGGARGRHTGRVMRRYTTRIQEQTHA